MFKDRYELNLLCENYLKRANDLKECLNVDRLNKEIVDLEEKVNSSDFWNDNKEASKVLKKIGSNKNHLANLNNLMSLVNDYKDLLEMDEDDEVNSLIEETIKEIDTLLEKMELEILLSGPFDDNNAIVEIHPGAGGVEAHDWADMLYRMYLRFCAKHNFKVEILDHLDGEEAGIKSVSFEVKGENAYGLLKSEKGVHRLVRISPFDANKRRHTSFASVEVTPKFDDTIEIELNEEDLKIDTYRASGAGGQHINKTDSAVRITHLPTGIVASCQTQRSQIQNKEYCLNVIKSKLYEKKMNEKQAELAKIKGESMANEWGSQIRSYVFCPYTMVKDHRSDYQVSDVNKVMDGDLDDFISAYLKLRND
jgi:peptide chain release factor 2